MSHPGQGGSVVVGKPQAAVAPGTVIAGKYRVERELGRGGFGIVVQAKHLQLNQLVAIKILTPGDGGEAEWQEDAARFRREAQATAALRGDYIVRILDVDVLDTGSPYMVMEYLAGETLHVVLHTRGPLVVAEAVDNVIEILAALAEAHAAGIVHRDLKPANVFVTRGAGGVPVAKVLDFGVSKMGVSTVSSSGAPAITRTGAVIGTVAYMAPEQMVDAKRVDGRADLWSAGLILYELLTKELPFGQANAPTLVTNILTKPPWPLSARRPDIPRELEAIVMRCLEKAPDNRFPSAAALAGALAPFATSRVRPALENIRKVGPPRGPAMPVERPRPEPPRPPTSGTAAPPPKRVTPVLVVAFAGAVVTVALLGVTAGMLFATSDHGKGRGRRAASSAASATDAGEAPSSPPGPAVPSARGR